MLVYQVVPNNRDRGCMVVGRNLSGVVESEQPFSTEKLARQFIAEQVLKQQAEMQARERRRGGEYAYTVRPLKRGSWLVERTDSDGRTTGTGEFPSEESAVSYAAQLEAKDLVLQYGPKGTRVEPPARRAPLPTSFTYPPGAVYGPKYIPASTRYPVQFEIESESKRGKWYRISYDDAPNAGYWVCSCPAGVNRGTCKHLRGYNLTGREGPVFESPRYGGSGTTKRNMQGDVVSTEAGLARLRKLTDDEVRRISEAIDGPPPKRMRQPLPPQPKQKEQQGPRRIARRGEDI